MKQKAMLKIFNVIHWWCGVGWRERGRSKIDMEIIGDDEKEGEKKKMDRERENTEERYIEIIIQGYMKRQNEREKSRGKDKSECD